MKNSTTNETYRSVFSTQLDKAMKLRHVDQKTLATKIGVTPQTVSYYVNDKRLPDADKLREIAEQLEVSADYLLGLQKGISTDIEIKEMSNRLGLSEKSLCALQILTKISCGESTEHLSCYDATTYLDIFNTLIEDNAYLNLFSDIQRYNNIFCAIEVFEAIKDVREYELDEVQLKTSTPTDEMYDGVQFNGKDIAITVKPNEAKYAILNKATDDLREIINKYIKNHPLNFGEVIPIGEGGGQ